MLTRRQRIMSGMVLLALMTAAIFTVTAQAQSVAPADTWKFSITPYLWLPTIDGTLKYNIPPGAGGSPSFEVGPNDYQFAMMISGEVRKDRWSVFTDIIYLSFSSVTTGFKSVDFGGSFVSSSANVSGDTSVRGAIWTLGAGYAVLPDRPVTLDVFGGFRYAGLEASTDWQLTVDINGPGAGQTFPRAGSTSQRMDLWDGIVGIRGHVLLGSSNWSIPYYLDAGAGSSIVTWQGLLGVAYSFKWGDVSLAYRYLYYDEGSDKLLQNMSFRGPALGVTFRF
jgi:hypothetical protein